jgi:hypothetical protein
MRDPARHIAQGLRRSLTGIGAWHALVLPDAAQVRCD